MFAAFSQDNTGLATNYLQHMLSVDFLPAERLILNATWYRYRPKNPIWAGGNEPAPKIRALPV